MASSGSGTAADALPCAEILALSRDPLALFTPDARIRAANPAFARTFAAIEEFTRPGTGFNLFLDEAARHGILSKTVCSSLRLLEERLATGADPAGGGQEVEATLPPDQTFAIALAPTTDEGFAMVISPAEDRAGAAQSEREVEELMTKVLEACPTSLTMARIGDGQILYRSPAATELLGKGRDSRVHFARREERADFVTTLLPDARVDDMRIRGRRPDGSEFPAAISARLIDYRGEEVVVSSMTDLTEEIALQDEVARQRAQIFQAEKMSALGELLAGVAHELNNPLSIVVGNALILQEENLETPIQNRVGKLSDAAERCVKIVRTFLSMARDRPLEIAPTPFDALVSTAIDAFRAGEQGPGLQITLDLADDLPDVAVDEVQIVQVLTNLLINAEAAMADAGTGGTVTLSGDASRDGRIVRLRVRDDGPGVPPDIAGRIFDPLFTTKSAGKGTGVGLALCHRIMTAHGGSIVLETGQRRGAGFVLEIPAA